MKDHTNIALPANRKITGALHKDRSAKHRRLSVLVVDEDLYYAQACVDVLSDAGFRAVSASSVKEAITSAYGSSFDAAIVDIKMPHGNELDPVETAGGHRTGLALARRLRDKCPSIKILGISADNRMQDVKDWFKSQTAMTFRGKLECPPAKLVAELTRLLGGQQRLPRIFIVHGRDTGTLLEVKNFIQNKLQFGEPIILADQPSRGRTIIEKFEAYAHQIDLVFVILTPDDIGQLAKSKVQDSRARQNVIFELGYFMGSLGRKNGRVILLRKGAIEIPSDLHGVVYLDISQGVQSVAEDIRQEINAWLR